MAGSLRRARKGLTIVILALFCVTLFAPMAALADTNLVVGGTARIAYANGDDVRLRETPAFEGAIVRYLPEGTIVDVVDGPVDGASGGVWFKVSFEGDSGYIVADYLALSDAATATAAADAATTATPATDGQANPQGESIGQAMIAGTNGDGVRCRIQADSGSAVITVVPEGTLVDLIGAAVDAWQPINCGGQSGFVHTDFVSYDLSGAAKPDAGAAAAPAADQIFGAAQVTGTGTISGTNGDGVRCRSAASANGGVVTVLTEGSSVELRGDQVGGWQPVVCAGSDGYVSSEFVSLGEATATTDAASTESVDVSASASRASGSVTVSGTNGDGVRCRSGAGFDSSVIIVLGEGTSVSLRGDPKGDWQRVVCGGSNGFIASEFLSTSGDGQTSGDGGGGGGGSVTGDGVISGTNGDGVRCRSGAGFNSSVLAVLSEGSSVQLRGSVEGDWQPVMCAGSNGWVFAEFVGAGGGTSGGGASGGGDGSPSNSSLVSGDTAVVSGTGGSGVRLRSGASFDASIVTVVGEGQECAVIDGSSGDWVAVSYGGTSGFINNAFLSASSDGGVTGGDAGGGGTSGGGGLADGDHAATSANLNLRYDPSYSSGIAAVAPEGTVVKITGNPSSGFYPVDWDGIQGYMLGDYLQFTDAALSVRGGSGNPGGGGGTSGDGGGGGGGSSAGGAGIVNFAMQYLGYPYIWATHGPSSFDCSGFTYWVVLNTLGMDIGAGTDSQIAVGTPIDQGNLQPGDLVFFQNTFTWGLSHVGIYIGGGQFIHAENDSTGVVISNLSSDYYASRWYGARRLA